MADPLVSPDEGSERSDQRITFSGISIRWLHQKHAGKVSFDLTLRSPFSFTKRKKMN